MEINQSLLSTKSFLSINLFFFLLVAKRYKTLHKYEYRYEAESLNAINGASPLKNGPKISCMVEIEVPQTCSFIVHTSGCSLTEVAHIDGDGNPVFSPAPSSDAFAAEMERYPLKVVVEGVYDVKLYPEDGETTTILNIKRGIISALAVPLVEEDMNKNMPTIHGKCKTHYTVNVRKDIATDINLTRDLSRCDKFVPIRDHTSPLALISGMHYPLAQLIRSSQTCNYKFDNEKKHMTSGSCIENHILIPFSHKGEYGVTNIGKQELTLVQVSPHNDRVFDHSYIVKGLHMETVEDKSAVQDKDAALNLLRELANLPETEGERRAHLFHRLVAMARGMKAETLSPAVPQAVAVSRVLTYQVLAQCGTPECSSAIMQILRTLDESALEVDAAVFALGLMSNPSALLINDMLQMARYKSSKPIMYALSNVIKRFYKAEGKVIPEIRSVAEFMAAQLGDCSGDKDNTFMTLRVIGNMAPAVIPESPALRSAVLQCVNHPAASPTVQQAAIQVYRLTPVPEESREVLLQVLLDNTSPMQKRIAAYLVLMKDPQPRELTQLADALTIEQDKQVKSFIISHITNILSSTEPKTKELRQKIHDAFQGNEIGPIMDPTKFSRNYKIGSIEGNMIFEGTSYLPKELMLEMTLKAFGYEIDMMEIGIEGKGFEPTVDALFGENGFFPDTALKTMYFVSENMPLTVNEILQNMLPTMKKDRMKRQATQNLMREIGHNLNKLVREVSAAQSPEAMVYLRFLGNELGYLRTNDVEEMANSAVMMIGSMFKMFPSDIMKALMTKTDNTIFAHYIFMDNEFFLPTVTGVPLKIALSGTFTPGIKGGLNVARDMSEVTFLPSAGIEFVTQVGSHIPEYVNSAIEMHTNIFHESGLTAKISMGYDNVKLTIPAPTQPTKLIKVTNTLVSVTGSEVRAIPPMIMDKVDVNECTDVFAGMKYCTALQYIDAFSQETAPYFPFTGDSKFAVELHPTGEVTEYTATVSYELLGEGEDGRQKVDSVKFILRAEGADPTEARAVLKYNRGKNVITADVQIPDYDVEAGLRLGVVDGNTKGKGTHSVSLDFINKNIPQLSLVGRANLKAMKEGMLQVQLLVPSIKTDATVTANMKREEELELELKSEIKFMDATSEQKIEIKYDSNKIEVELKSDVNTETTILPNAGVFQNYGNELLDMQVGQTDMKVRHIFKKFVEATNNYMERYGAEFPFLQNFRVPDMPEIAIPKTLYLNTEAKAVYYFNNERFVLSIPVPLGGKSREELNIPPSFTTPTVSLPQFGLEITSMEIPIPELIVPESFTLSIPLFGKVELSTLMRSNFYNVEASMAAGKDVVEAPSYSAKFDVKGTSPLDILSMNIEGSGVLAMTDSIKAQVKSSLVHKFIEASIIVMEQATISDNIHLRSNSKIEATSPFGLKFSVEHTGMAGINTEEISADNNFEGTFKAGPVYGKTVSTQSFTIFPFRPEAKIDSTVQFDSTIVRGQNTIAASLANGEFSMVSKTNAFEDVLTHVAEFSFKDNKLSLKCDANALALGMKLRNQIEASAGVGEMVMRMETNADHTENRVYSLLTASLHTDSLALNSDASMKLLQNEVTHKASLKMNKNGVTIGGTTTLNSLLSIENTFNAGLDASRATLSVTNKAAMQDIMLDNVNTMTVTLSSFDFNSKAEATASEYAMYAHEITIDLKPFTASAKVNNNMKLLAANFINEAQLAAELYKMDLTGSLKAIYGEEEIKHTYQVNYADMKAYAKCSTTGRLLGTHMNQNTELEVIGLAARITNDARFNSQPVRFDHTVRCSIVPFDFNVDAIFNADGDIVMYGKHSGQLYSKFLLKAQPLAFASSHECRAAVTQQLQNGFVLETTFDNKMETLLSIQEQRTSSTIKSKVNEQVFNQEMSVYNTAERTGIELSGTILTSILNTDSTENQEFTISGFLKYDKNTDSHIIQMPLLKNLPAFLESIKGIVVRVAEALQDYINNPEVKAKLEALPQHINDFVSQLDFEGKVNQLKQYFSDFTQKYFITVEDVETSLKNLEVAAEKLLSALTGYIQHVAGVIIDNFSSGNLFETLIHNFQQQLNAFNEEYDLKSMAVYVINAIREIVHLTDLEKLKGSSIAFLYDIDAKYEIKAHLQTILEDIKDFIETFDLLEFVTNVKWFFSRIDFKAHLEAVISQIPTDIFTDVINYIREIIQGVDIVGKINTFYANIRDLIVKFEAEQKIQAVLETTVELIKQFRIEETIKAVIKMVRNADIPTKVTHLLQDAVNYLKSTEVKDILQHLNMYIETLVQGLNSLNYNTFVVHANQIIAKYTSFINELIRTFEIPQKLEATREFVHLVSSSVRDFTEYLKEIKCAEIIKSVKDMIDEIVLNNLMSFAELSKQIIGFQDVQAVIDTYVESLKQYYLTITTFISDMFCWTAEILKNALPMSYIPTIRDINFSEITLPEISLPSIPVEKLVKSLQVPEIKLPTIPSQIMVPCFGKIYGDIKFLTPIYTIKTSAEFHNSTENELTPKFTGALISEARSSSFEILNYKLESSVRIAIPKRSRVLVAETMKFQHLALGVEHQASVNLYGLSGQAQAKTAVRITTLPYTAEISNAAFIAMEGGMSASLETTCAQEVNMPIFGLTSKTTVRQKSVALQDGLSFTLTVENLGTGNINGDDGTHKSNLYLSLTPSITTLTSSVDTNSPLLKMKQQIAAECVTFTYFKFNVRNEVEAPVIKNSLFVASGNANLNDMKLELKANHDTELHGIIRGVMSSGLNFLVHPAEFIFEFQNKGNAKRFDFDSLAAKMDLQNDYSIILRADNQQINTVALVRFNQYKIFYNFTADNNKNEAGIFVAMEGEANVDFLTYPINIPEFYLPFVDFRTPAISNLNVYEQTGLKNILTTTEQTVDVDAKIVYKKSQTASLFDIMGLIQIPCVDNLITELSFKSAIINLNVNAGLYAEDDFVFRLGATTASVFESLRSKLHGTTSLTTKRGIKFANSLSLENRHIEGTHDSSITMSTETLEYAISAATIMKMDLSILRLEANQNLVVNPKSTPPAISTLTMKSDFNIPVIKAVGKAEAEHSLKLEGTLEYVSMGSSIKANMDGTVLDDFLVLGVLDNEVNLYLNIDGLRSTSKIIADAKLNYRTNKIFAMDVNENFDIAASRSQVYAVLKYTGNNEVNLFDFNTNGKHVAKAIIDFRPMSTLTADIEIDISQPSSLGELAIFEKTVAEITAAMQKMSTNAKFESPLYTTNLAAEVVGNAPFFKGTLKSSATSVIVFLEYNMDVSTTANFENEALNTVSKVVLTHGDLAMDLDHIITQALSISRHSLNVDITSPTFTDLNLRYAAQRDSITASVSTPSSGFLGLQFNGRAPSDMVAKLYGRFPSIPDVDVDILVMRSSIRDGDKINLQFGYNMEAPKVMLNEIKMRGPSIISAFTRFAHKYKITNNMEELKNAIVMRFTEIYNVGINYDHRMSQLSIFFRNIIVEYQKTVQVFLDTVIMVLRETQFTLPGSDKKTTLPEIMKKLTSSIAATLEIVTNIIYENIEVYHNIFVEKVSSMKLRMPIGDVINWAQILDQFKTGIKKLFNEMVDFVRNMESLDTMLVKIGETLKAIVEKSQEFADVVKSDYLDAVLINVNILYRELLYGIRNVVNQISVVNMEWLNNTFEQIVDMFIYAVDQFNDTIYGFLQQASEVAQVYVKVSQGKLEIDLPFPFQQ
uniref:Apolipoprotein Bb, tandem duplicate 2 n=1 Tax=Echeneis naucrates TaxID=173247 RepID=A0A665W8E5_ECHNA